MLREAQSATSARTSARVSPITSAFVSQANTLAPPSPKSPPNSPNVEFSDSEDLAYSIYINRPPTRRVRTSRPSSGSGLRAPPAPPPPLPAAPRGPPRTGPSRCPGPPRRGLGAAHPGRHPPHQPRLPPPRRRPRSLDLPQEHQKHRDHDLTPEDVGRERPLRHVINLRSNPIHVHLSKLHY